MTKGKFRPFMFITIVWLHVMAAYALWYVCSHGFQLHAFLVGAAWFIGLYTVRQVGISLGNHRLFTHASFKCHFVTELVLAYLSGFAAQGPLQTWCPDHMQHHWDTEGEWDPHTPTKYEGWKGFWWAHIGWLFYEVIRPPTPDFDAMFKRSHRRLIKWDRPLNLLGTLSGFVLPYYFSGTGDMLFSGFFGVVFHLYVTWFVNSGGHIWGSTDERFRRRRDQSKNNWFLAIIAWIGEAFHFNHHAKPDSAFLGWKWYEPDLGKWILMVGEPLGIFWDIKPPPDDA